MSPNIRSIATHDGTFHADDVFSIAVLSTLYPEANVIRTRDQAVLDACDLVVDVGAEYDHTRMRYDHHQNGFDDTHENGVKRSGFGLVWKHYGEAYCGSQYIFDRIEKSLVQTIDAIDNGQTITEKYAIKLKPQYISEYFDSFNPYSAEATATVYDNNFFIAVDSAKQHLERLKMLYGHEELDAVYFAEQYAKSSDKRYVVLEKNIPYTYISMNYPDLLYVIHIRENGNWGVFAVPIDEFQRFTSRLAFPPSWRGLRNVDISKASEIAGATFCHNTGFYAACLTKEDAIAFAERSMALQLSDD